MQETEYETTNNFKKSAALHLLQFTHTLILKTHLAYKVKITILIHPTLIHMCCDLVLKVFYISSLLLFLHKVYESF